MKIGYVCQSSIIFLIAALAASSALPQSKRVPSDSDIALVGKRTLGGVTNDFPIDHEMKLGEELSSQIEHDFWIIDDPVVTDYMNSLVRLLAENSDVQIPIKAQVIYSANPIAIFLAGGYLFISSSLVVQTHNEAELAGILAHGVAHTALRSETRNILQLTAIPATIFVYGEPLGEPFWLIGTTSVPPSAISRELDAEFDADYFGLQYVYKAGFDPNCFIDFIDRMSRASAKKTPFNFHARPIASERIQPMRKEASEIFPPRAFDVVSTSEYDTVRARLRQIKLPVPSFRKRDDFDPPIIRYSPKPGQTTNIN